MLFNRRNFLGKTVGLGALRRVVAYPYDPKIEEMFPIIWISPLLDLFLI